MTERSVPEYAEGPTCARVVKARYTLAGVGAEIDKTLPLEDGERVLVKGQAMETLGLGLSRLVADRLTKRRGALLRHHFLKSGHGVVIPRGALATAPPSPGGI